jgi:hypothetical protein
MQARSRDGEIAECASAFKTPPIYRHIPRKCWLPGAACDAPDRCEVRLIREGGWAPTPAPGTAGRGRSDFVCVKPAGRARLAA